MEYLEGECGPALEVGDGEVALVAIVRDRLGRVCVDEEIFRDPERLNQIAEAVRNGSNAPNSNS